MTLKDLKDFRPSMTNAARDGLGAIDKLIKDVNSAGLYSKYMNDLAALRNDYINGVLGPFNQDKTGEFPFHSGSYSKDEYNAFAYFLDQGYLARVRAFYKTIHATVSDGSGILLPNGALLGGGNPKIPSPNTRPDERGLVGLPGTNRGPAPGTSYLPGVGIVTRPGSGPTGRPPPSGLDAPGPWNGGGYKKHVGGGTGQQPADGGGRKGIGGGSSGSSGGSGGGGLGDGAADTRNQVLSGDLDVTCGTGTYDFGTVICTPKESGRPSDDGSSGGADEGPRVHKGGPYFTPHGGSTGGVGVIVAGGLGPRVPGSPISYLDFLHKGVGPQDGDWGGNNPVVTPAIKPSDLFKPADDSIGPYNPKGTDYRPAPDDPTPGGPAGAAGRATRVRVG